MLKRLALAALVTVLAACADGVTNTGYTGTWERGNGTVTSTFSIVEDDEAGYRLRWRKVSTDGRLHVDCDWDGHCEEFFDGELMLVHELRAWVDPEKDRLRLEHRVFQGGDEIAKDRRVDELRIVGKDGLGLMLVQFERGQEQLPPGDRPKIKGFRKTSDRVDDGPS